MDELPNKYFSLCSTCVELMTAYYDAAKDLPNLPENVTEEQRREYWAWVKQELETDRKRPEVKAAKAALDAHRAECETYQAAIKNHPDAVLHSNLRKE